MVTGNLDLSPPIPPASVFPVNDIEPLAIPVPFDTSVLSKLNPVILPPPFNAIVISLLCNVR